MFIYKVTNRINNKIYIGLTVQTIQERFWHHHYEARQGSKSYFHRALLKHKPENFIVEQIDIASSIEELKQKEINYIKQYNATNRKIGYNLSEGGDGSPGNKLSDKTKNKIRQKALGRTASEKTKIKMSLSKKGRKAHPNTLISIIERNIINSKKVAIFHISGRLIKIVNSITECSKYFNCSRPYIQSKLNKTEDINKTFKREYILRVV